MATLLLYIDEGTMSEEQRAEVQALVPEMRVIQTRDEDEISSLYDDIEIAAGHLSPEMVLEMPNLSWAQHWAAGVDAFVKNDEIVQKDFTLTNASGVHGIPISEHILAFLLAFARNLHVAVRAQNDHTWLHAPDSGQHPVFELAGKTMLLIGVGAIGQRTAKMATDLGMRVFGVRRHPSEDEPGVAEMYAPDELLDILPEVDFVVVTVPLTDETRDMIGEEELRAMKSSSIIFNIGRGGTINEPALIRALKEGWIGGAGLDVFETEPLPEDSPLWDMKQVIITAHYAGHTPHYDDRATAIFLDNLRRYVADRPLRNEVNMKAGY